MKSKLKRRLKLSLQNLAGSSFAQDLWLSTIKFPECIQVRSPYETLDTCQNLIQNKIRGAYLRFGDGDIYLLTGRDEKLQQANAKLKQEMEECFNLAGSGIMKSLGLHSHKFGASANMVPGMHLLSDEVAVFLLSQCFPYFIGTPIYSSIALPYVAAFDREYALSFLRFLKSEEPVLFIGNQMVPEGVLQQLFGNIIHISTPQNNSYSSIDQIEQKILQLLDKNRDKFSTLIIAMGCSGRPLAKRLYLRDLNIFTFDFGSLLDAFCGWDTRTWIKIAPSGVRDLLREL